MALMGVNTRALAPPPSPSALHVFPHRPAPLPKLRGVTPPPGGPKNNVFCEFPFAVPPSAKIPPFPPSPLFPPPEPPKIPFVEADRPPPTPFPPGPAKISSGGVLWGAKGLIAGSLAQFFPPWVFLPVPRPPPEPGAFFPNVEQTGARSHPHPRGSLFCCGPAQRVSPFGIPLGFPPPPPPPLIPLSPPMPVSPPLTFFPC